MMTEVNWKDRKLPVHWKSRIPKADKRNSITHIGIERYAFQVV